MEINLKTSSRSVDEVQRELEKSIFVERRDAFKATGRALGTIQEIIVYFLFEVYNIGERLFLEYPLPEYGRPDIVHNVEFSIHPLVSIEPIEYSGRVNKNIQFPKELKKNFKEQIKKIKTSVTLIEKNREFDRETRIINPCFIRNINEWTYDKIFKAGYVEDTSGLFITNLSKPISFIECKRVGLETGTTTGPQTIEKAKQAAYLALRCSKLQKIITSDDILGFLDLKDRFICRPYEELWSEILDKKDVELLNGVVRSIIFLSNHINWYLNDIEKKDLHILKQSYDWTIWIEDKALAEFVKIFILPEGIIRNVFYKNYVQRSKGGTFFTKNRLDNEVYRILYSYFRRNKEEIARNWLTVLSPEEKTFIDLINEIKNILEIYEKIE